MPESLRLATEERHAAVRVFPAGFAFVNALDDDAERMRAPVRRFDAQIGVGRRFKLRAAVELQKEVRRHFGNAPHIERKEQFRPHETDLKIRAGTGRLGGIAEEPTPRVPYRGVIEPNRFHIVTSVGISAVTAIVNRILAYCIFNVNHARSNFFMKFYFFIINHTAEICSRSFSPAAVAGTRRAPPAPPAGKACAPQTKMPPDKQGAPGGRPLFLCVFVRSSRSCRPGDSPGAARTSGAPQSRIIRIPPRSPRKSGTRAPRACA